MEESFRGWVEKQIDDLLDIENNNVLESVISFSESFPIKSTEDFCFGLILGFIYCSIDSDIRLLFERKPTDAEIEEARKIIFRRANEIKSTIKLVMSK